MILSSRNLNGHLFRRGGMMQASELGRRLRNEVRRSPRPSARFAELVRGSQAVLPSLETDPSLRITLNPVRAWLHEADAAILPEVSTGPQPTPGADVVLFVVNEEVRTYAATMPERALLHQLAEIGPTTLDLWLAHDSAVGRLGATRGELAELVRATTAAGLTALS
jgi:hypothetical protein